MKIEKIIIKRVIVISILCMIGLFFINTNQMDYAQGVVVGALVSILKLLILKKNIAREIGMEEKKVFIYSLFNYSMRYIMTGIILIAAIIHSMEMFIGVVIGLMTLRIALLLEIYKK